MQILCTSLRVAHIFTRQALAVFIAGVMLSQPLMASDSWSPVEKIKKGARIYVHNTNGQFWEGTFLRADTSGITFRVANQGEVDLDRDEVTQVAVKRSGRRWYSIPLTVAAAAAGGFGGYQIADRTTCSGNYDKCGKAKGVIISFSALGAAGLAYGLTRGKSGWDIIYTK